MAKSRADHEEPAGALLLVHQRPQDQFALATSGKWGYPTKWMALSDPHHPPVCDAAAEGSGSPPRQSVEAGHVSTNEVDLDQIIERLQWTPKQRLDYLLDMLAFEERARLAVRVS